MTYFDIERQVRDDPEYAQKIRTAALELKEIRAVAKHDPKLATLVTQKTLAMIRLCQHNLAYLSTFFFPQYPKDKPLSYVDYPFAVQMFAMMLSGYIVVRGSRQIGKSSALAPRQIMHADLYPGFTSTYICPRLQYLQTYANRLRDMHAAYRYKVSDYRFRDNLYYKEFPNGSKIQLLYILTSAANARSKSSDELIFDEYQEFDADLELEVCQIQSASKFRTRIYAGTSLTTTTALEDKFAESSQGYWMTFCPSGHPNLPLPETQVMDMIQPQGPSCSTCGKLLDMSSGTFEHLFHSRIAENKVGFHIPQLINPEVYRNRARWLEICDLKKNGNTRKFNQEILGIPSEEGEREINRKHLQLICTLGTDLARLKELAVSNNEYDYVVSGCDWGGSDFDASARVKVSTTVHVIIGVKGDGTTDILHFRRYLGMEYKEIIADILRQHEAHNAKFIGTDFGVGYYYNAIIRESLDVRRHFMFNLTAPNSQLLSHVEGVDAVYNHWNLNKTESLSSLFDAVKTQRIRCFAWEIAQEFLMDFVNVYRVPTELPSGRTGFRYVGHPNKTTDALMALNFAYTMARLLRGEPMTNNASLLAWAATNQPGSSGDLEAAHNLDAFSAFSG